MIIELDVGNSRIKWRMQSNRAQYQGVAKTAAKLFAQIGEKLAVGEVPDAILVASVRSDDSLGQIVEWSKQNWQLRPRLAIVSAESSGVTNSYSDVSRMGIDRWLAMLAAFHRTQSACLIVDSGTALTIDALSDTGQHLGGYILPGLGLGVAAIETNTGIRLKQRELDSAQLEFGTNTESAVLNGVLAQAIALIEKAAYQLGSPGQVEQNTKAVQVLLSGGDAATLQAALANNESLKLEYCPSLVLDGLALAETEELE